MYNLSAKVSEKGAVSVYGMGRFPTTLYAPAWRALATALPSILTFIDEQEAAGKLAAPKAQNTTASGRTVLVSASPDVAVRQALKIAHPEWDDDQIQDALDTIADGK